MKRRTWWLRLIPVLAVALIALAAGCASQGDMDKTRSEMAALEQQIAELKLQAEASTQAANQFKSEFQSSTGAVASRVQGLEESRQQAETEARGLQTQVGKHTDTLADLVARLAQAEGKATQEEGRLADVARSLLALENTYSLSMDKLDRDVQALQKGDASAIGALEALKEEVLSGRSDAQLREVPSLLLVALLADSEETQTSVLETVGDIVKSSGNAQLLKDWEDAGFSSGGPDDYLAFDYFLAGIAEHLAGLQQGSIAIPRRPATAYVEGIGQPQVLTASIKHADGQSITYDTIPPSSGEHWGVTVRCGFYVEETPDEALVHNLEHGNVVISYDLPLASDVDKLKALHDALEGNETWLVTRAYPKLKEGEVAIAAWGVLDRFNGVDAEGITRFYNTYAGNAMSGETRSYGEGFPCSYGELRSAKPSLVTNTQPAWSPDGSRIAFSTDRDGNREIYVMNADGASPTRITSTVWSDNQPSWSPDGTKLAYVAVQDARNDDIYVMNADGSARVRLTTSSYSDYKPMWSPDGARIAFVSRRDGNAEIYVMNTDGSGQTALTKNAWEDEWPTWSPDGTKIAFRSNRDGNWEIYAMNADGTGQTRLTNNAADERGPAWSPDGATIAFTTQRDGNRELYVINADGSNPIRLTSTPAEEFGPSWSPDSKRLAFPTDRDGHQEIYVMNADGSDSKRLTNT